jgi:hypothetical protein
VVQVENRYEPWIGARLVLDAIDPLEVNLRRLRDYLFCPRSSVSDGTRLAGGPEARSACWEISPSETQPWQTSVHHVPSNENEPDLR